MQRWTPRVTVATVIERDGRYLMVEERDKSTQELVLNQPAGHLEQGETITAAALRETLEETGWQVELRGFLGIGLYTAPHSGITYYRNTFAAETVQQLDNATLDPDIHATHWLDYKAILANSARMRSPLVIASIEQHRRGVCYPLDLIYSQ